MKQDTKLDRYSFKEEADVIQLTIPVRENWIDAVFTLGILATLCFILVRSNMFPSIAFYITEAISSGEFPPLSSLVTMTLGLAMIVWATFRALWRGFGYEELKIDADSLSLRRVLFGFSKTYTYKKSDIKDLRYLSMALVNGGQKVIVSLFSIKSGIRFEVGKKTVTIGKTLDETQAKTIEGIIAQKFSLIK